MNIAEKAISLGFEIDEIPNMEGKGIKYTKHCDGFDMFMWNNYWMWNYVELIDGKYLNHKRFVYKSRVELDPILVANYPDENSAHEACLEYAFENLKSED